MTTIRRYVALLLGLGMLWLAVWIVLPAPTYFLLTFGVGSPEVSPWLMMGSLVALALSFRDRRAGLVGRVAFAGSLAALLLSTTPLARTPATIRRFDASMRAALGDEPLRAVAPEVKSKMRPHPIAIGELFRRVTPGGVSVTRGVRVAMHSDVSLTTDIYRPLGGTHLPIVVQIYGGAWQGGEPGKNAEFARWLASRGYVVFAIDYAHAPRYRWPAQIDDIRTALAWIRDRAARYDADTTRVALLGRSSGGHLALMAGYTPGPLPIRAVVNYYGPADLIDAFAHPPHPDPLDIRSREISLLGGTPDQMPDRYREASPITYATKPLPPTLSIYGGRDHLVEPRYGARLTERLSKSGTTAIYLEIPWAEHAFDEVTNGPSAQLQMYYTERFLAWAMTRSDQKR